MTMDRTNLGREAEEEIQRQKEKRTVSVGVSKDLIQGITKVMQSPTGTVEGPKSRNPSLSQRRPLILEARLPQKRNSVFGTKRGR